MASSAQWLTFTKPFCGIAIVIIRILQGKIVLRRRVILHQGFPQNGRNRHDTLFVVFAVDDDKVLVYVLLLDAAQLPTPNTSFKQCSQHRCVTDLQKITAFARLHHPPHVRRLKRHDNGLVLLAPLKVFLCVKASVALIIAVLNERLCHFEKPVDVTAFSALGTHVDGELPHHGKRQIINLCYSRFFLKKEKKEIEIIPITPNGFRSKLPNLNLYEILSFCSADFHAFSSFCMSQSKEKRMSQRI